MIDAAWCNVHRGAVELVERRDLKVPIGIPRAGAISASLKLSTPRAQAQPGRGRESRKRVESLTKAFVVYQVTINLLGRGRRQLCDPGQRLAMSTRCPGVVCKHIANRAEEPPGDRLVGAE